MIKDRKNYIIRVIQHKMDGFQSEFFQYLKILKLNKNTNDKQENIEFYWNYVEYVLCELVNKLSLQDIHVYSASAPRSEIEEDIYLEMVAFARADFIPNTNVKYIKKHFVFEIKDHDVLKGDSPFVYGSRIVNSNNALKKRIK